MQLLDRLFEITVIDILVATPSQAAIHGVMRHGDGLQERDEKEYVLVTLRGGVVGSIGDVN